MLLGELRRRVDVPRVSGRFFVDQSGQQQFPRHGVSGVEDAGIEVGTPPRGGCDRVVGAGGGVPSLAINDHRRGEHEAPDAGTPHRREKFRGGEDIGGDVVGRIGEIDAQSHLRSLMRDGVDPAQRTVEHLGVTDIAADHLDIGVEHRRSPMHVVAEGVQDAHLVASDSRRLDDAGADEAGAARDEKPHQVRPEAARPSTSARAPSSSSARPA